MMHDFQSKIGFTCMHMLAMHVTLQIRLCSHAHVGNARDSAIAHRHTKTCAHGCLDTANLSVNEGAAGGQPVSSGPVACMHA
jgi:hypothetical protein